MGVAAYNRGSNAISQRISMESRPAEFELMDVFNSLAKYPDAGTPFGPIHFVPFRDGWFAECPRTGYGFWYPTIHEAIKRWNVRVVGFDSGTWQAVRA